LWGLPTKLERFSAEKDSFNVRTCANGTAIPEQEHVGSTADVAG